MLAEPQHQFHDVISCTTHAYLDSRNCLEVTVVKGKSEQVRAIADRLISTRGGEA